MFMNFKLDGESRDLIDTIVSRFFEAFPDHPRDRTSVVMDLIACHNGGCPLDFGAMATFEDFAQVSHDITGIGRYLDRETGEMDSGFAPRFALPEPPSEPREILGHVIRSYRSAPAPAPAKCERCGGSEYVRDPKTLELDPCPKCAFPR